MAGQRQGAPTALGLRLLVDEALPADPVDAPPDGERAGVQVDVGPIEKRALRTDEARPPGPRLPPRAAAIDLRRLLTLGLTGTDGHWALTT